MSQSLEDKSERQFKCPCSKTYLSYPALFTHIKQKHDGIPPGEIDRPKAANKRGRPRKIPLEQEGNELNIIIPEFKTYASRFLFNTIDQQNFKQYITQIQNAKDRFQNEIVLRKQGNGQIDKKHRQMNKTMDEIRQKKDHGDLRLELKDLLEPLHKSVGILTSSQLDVLIKANLIYLTIKTQTPQPKLTKINQNTWSMNLTSAIVEFLEWTQDSLSRWQFKNIEIVMSLLIRYFHEEVKDGSSMTTIGYATHVNNFGYYFLSEIKRDKKYVNVYSLENKRPFILLVCFHNWLVKLCLTNLNVDVNPNFSEENGGNV